MSYCRCAGRMYAEKERRGGALLEWKSCDSCGRCDYFTLWINDELIESGENARLRFLELENLPMIRAIKKPKLKKVPPIPVQVKREAPTAYKEGRKAHQRGHPMLINPYFDECNTSEFSTEYLAYMRGWLDGRADATRYRNRRRRKAGRGV